MYIQYFFLCPPFGLCIFVVSWIVVDMYLDDVILPGQGREWRVESEARGVQSRGWRVEI